MLDQLESVDMEIEVTAEAHSPLNKFRATCNRFPGVIIEADTHEEALYMAAGFFKDLVVCQMGADSGTITNIYKHESQGN
jgi:hypothetical protein